MVDEIDIDEEFNQNDEEDKESNDDESDYESNGGDSDNGKTSKEAKDQSIIEMNQQNSEDEEYSDDNMSNQDEMMEEFDSKLSEFFKNKKFGKKKKKGKYNISINFRIQYLTHTNFFPFLFFAFIDAKYQKIHYKHKVIGLLKIFVKEQQSNPLIFELIVPLLEVAKNTKTDEIARSVFTLLNNRIVIIKDSPTKFDDSRVLTLLDKIQDMARTY